MDDAGIQAELSRLSAGISALDRKFSEIDRKLGSIDRQVGVVGDSVSSLAATVGPAVTRIQSGLARLADELRRDREIDAARDRRDDLDRQLKDKFGRHAEVRKLGDSIVHAVRTGVIDDQVILDVAQRRMVDQPDYWLAPAIVAVAAWLSDDAGKCAEAVNLAMRLDWSKTALFMALLLHEHDRGDALQRWIDAYLKNLRPTNLPADFLVVIDAVVGGALRGGAAPRLTSWMISSYRDETMSRPARAEVIGEWTQRLRSFPSAHGFAPALARSCPDWEALRQRHAANIAIAAADRHFRDRFEAGADVPADLTERMRELVTKLAHTPDPEEEKIIRDRRLEEAVARTGEREEAQRRLTAEEAGRTGSLNMLSLVAASAFPASADGEMPGPTATELLAIVLSGGLIADAVSGLHDGTACPAAVTVRVGRFQERVCEFSCATGADTSREALLQQAVSLHAGVMAEIGRESDEQQHRLRKFLRRPLPVAVSSAAVIAAVPFAVPVGLPAVDFAAPAVAIAAGAGSWVGFLLGRRRQIQSVGVRDNDSIRNALNNAAAELADFFAAEDLGTRLRDTLPRFLRDLTPEDARRAVRRVESPPLPRTRGFPAWTPLPPADQPGSLPPDVTRPLP